MCRFVSLRSSFGILHASWLFILFQAASLLSIWYSASLFFSIFVWLYLLYNAIVSICGRGTILRLYCPGYIYFSNQRQNLVSLFRLSRLCLVNLFSSFTDFSDCAANISIYCIRIREYSSCAYQRHVMTLVSAFDAIYLTRTIKLM